MGAATEKQPLIEKDAKDAKPTSTRRYWKHPGPVGAFLEAVWPYILLARINGLIGVWLTFWPCTWGAAMAAYHYNLPPKEVVTLLPFLFLGCLLMHSAACVINDIFDREVDRLVERTKNRPLAARVIPVWTAWVWLVILTGALLYLLTFTNRFCAIVTLINLPVQFVYPLFKRFTYWPSFFLGLTFSWGSLVGWSALTGSLVLQVNGPLYIAGMFWAFAYDVIYGHQDAADDEQAGVKSAALALKACARDFLYMLNALFVVFLIITGIENEHGYLYFVFTVGPAAVHTFWQISTVDLTSSDSCFDKFYSNSWIGWPMMIGLVADYYVKITA